MYKVYLFTDYDSIDEEKMQMLFSIMPESRKQRALKYRQKIDYINSVISYAMLVYGLNKNYQISEFFLASSDRGKPYLRDHPDIHFSISHCKYGCVCAISDNPVGIDIQDIRSITDDVIFKVCTEQEKAHIFSADDKNKAFAEIWAMKESFVKKSGVGISDDLKSVDTFIGCSRVITQSDDFVIALSL